MNPNRANEAISMIDLTNLNDDCTPDDVEQLCRRAIDHRVAAVCVWPDFVRQAAASLADEPIGVATVVNFPSGDERPFSVALQTEHAIAGGATEIDVVLPYRAFAMGDRARPAEVLDGVRGVADGAALMKVILESGELSDLDVVRASADFAIDHGADFIKTSTGKSPVSATVDAVDVMLEAIRESGRRVGIKPSGGISTAAAAMGYLDRAAASMGDEWATPETFRFGASGLLTALVEISRPD